MSSPEILTRPEARVPVVATADVVVVGGGPAGISAAVSAARNGASAVLMERYPYLGGLASGGMVLVLDDMHNDTEISVRGLAMEIVERMHAKGLCVYPPEADRDPAVRTTDALWRKWARWGLYDFYANSKPYPIIFAASFDPDGFKQASLDMVREAGVTLRLHSWFQSTIVEDGRAAGVIVETKEGAQAIRGSVVVDATGDLDVAAGAGAPFAEGVLHRHHGLPHGWRGYGRGRTLPVRGARAFRRDRPQGPAPHRGLLAALVAEDPAARHRLVQLPAHVRLRRPQGGGPYRRRVRRPATHAGCAGVRARARAGLRAARISWTSRPRPGCARPACSKASTSSPSRT